MADTLRRPREAVRRLGGIGLAAGATLAVLLTAALFAREPEPAAVTSTNPVDGSTLAHAPTQVDLAFTEPVDPDAFHVSVRDGSGTELMLGPAHLAAPDRLRQPLAAAAVGEVTVTYHVTFSRGTELVGTVRFGVGVAPSGAAERVAATDPAHGHGVDPVSAVLLAVDGIVALAAVILLMRRPAPVRASAGRLHRRGRIRARPTGTDP
jgi:methionine-rich copper-binding protein CopC